MKVQKISKRGLQEKQILKSLKKAPYVVQIVDQEQTKKHLLLILTIGVNGNALSFLSNKEKLTSLFVSQFFQKLMIGVKAIHSAGFVHADLKLENVVIDKNFDPIIIDFDMAVPINSSESPRGTMWYMAPEIVKNFSSVKNLKYTPEIDLYSLSVMFYEMFYQYKPYEMVKFDYLGLLKNDITFEVNTPKNIFNFIKSGIMPKSKRSEFSNAFSIINSNDFIKSENLEKKETYQMIEFASEDEKNTKKNLPNRKK